MELLLWQNLMFLLPLLLAVLYLLVLATGSDGDGQHDGGYDGTGHDGAGHDHGGDDAGHDHDSESDFSKVLALIGIGRVPLSLLLVTLLVIWGGTGLISNQVVGTRLWPLSAGIAALSALFFSGFISNTLGRIIQTRSYGVSREALVGQTAKATVRISSEMGEARLIDRSGTLRDLPVRVSPGSAEILADSEVLLVTYEQTQGVFLVRPLSQ